MHILQGQIFFGPATGKTFTDSIEGLKPYTADNGQPTAFQEATRNHRAEHDDILFFALEQVLAHAGFPGGCQSPLYWIHTVHFLRPLRHLRMTTVDPEKRKQLSFQMRKRQRQETEDWKSKQLH